MHTRFAAAQAQEATRSPFAAAVPVKTLERLSRSQSTAARRWDWLAATDPGLLRLLLAARGTLSVVLTGVWVVGIASWLHQEPLLFAGGVIISMLGAFLMREPTSVERRKTLLILMVSAAASVTATSLLHGTHLAGEVFFLVLLFVTVVLQPLDPRALGIGLVAVIETYVGLYLRLPPQTLPLQWFGLITGGVATAFICSVVLPWRPATTLRRAIRSVQRRTAHILREVRLKPNTPGLTSDLNRHLMRLNEAALAAEEQLDVVDVSTRTAMRLQLFELEQAVRQLMSVLGGTPISPRMHNRLAVAEVRLRRGRGRHRPAMPEDAIQHPLGALEHAASRLSRIADSAVAHADRPVDRSKIVRGRPAWRMATQVTVAATLAMAGGMALSSERWFWAVLAAYIVFLNTRSRGEAIYRGVHRVIGTLAGLFVGLGLAVLTGSHPWVVFPAIIAAVFCMYYFYAVSYGLAILSVTIMLGLLYGALGSPLEPILMLRLEETALGVASAILAAVFFLPVSTRQQVQLSGQSVLRAISDVVRLCREARTGVPGLEPIEAVRRLDRQIVDLRRSLLPLLAGRQLLRVGRSGRPATALLACAHWARVLAAVCRRPDQSDPDEFAGRADRIEARIQAMLGNQPNPPSEVEPAGSSAALVALDNLDRALDGLRERLQASVLDGFALE